MENNEQKNPINQPAKKPTMSKTAPKGVPRTIGSNTSSANNTKAAPKGMPKTISTVSGTQNNKQSTTNSDILSKPKVKEIDSKSVSLKEDNTGKKKKNKKLILILLLLLIAVAAVGTAIYFITKVPKTDMKFSIVTKTEFNNTEIDSGGDERELIYVPGDIVDASLEIKIENDKGTITSSEKVYLRFRIDIIIDGNNYYGGLFDPEFEYPEDWVYNSADNYYYYNYYCYGKEKFTPFDSLDFVGDRYNNMLNGKTGQIVFTVEILEGNANAVSDLWNTAPKDWKPVKK